MTLSGICLGLFVAAGAAAPQDLVRSDDVLDSAKRLASANELDKATELLTDLLRRDPANQVANLMLGEIRLTQGLHEDALKSFESVLASDLGSASALQGEVKAAEAAALADRNAGLDGSALLCLLRARKFAPDSPRLLLDFGV